MPDLFSQANPVTPISGSTVGARATGLTTPILAQVDDGALVGRWFMSTSIMIPARNGGAPAPTLNAYPADGITRNNLSGTAFAAGRAIQGGTIDDGSKGPMCVFVSSAAIGGVAGFQPSQNDLVDPAKLPVYTVFIKTQQVAGIRLWVGFYSGGACVQNSDDPGFPGGADTNFAGFRYSDGVDGGFVGVCRNAVGAVFSASPTIKAIADLTEYQLRVRILSATSVGFSVNGEQEVFISGATCPDWTNANNRFLNGFVSHCNKTAVIHRIGFMGDLLYLAG